MVPRPGPPGLIGAVLATAVKFYVYGNYKWFGARCLGRKEDDPVLHAQG